MWYLMKRCHGIVLCLMVIVVLAPRHAAAAPDSINFANKGKAQCVIVVPAGAMAENVVFPRRHVDYVEHIAEIKRQLLRDSVRDLAHYLGKIAGAEFEVVESRPPGDQRNPIYVGKRAQRIFGPVGITKSGAFGFRVVADPKRGIGLYGESEHGTSYAIYELLHQLGCRWYMPTELGEVIPRRITLTVPIMDHKRAPATEYRGMTQGGADWKRRNRFTTTGKRLGRLPGRIGNGVGYDGTRVTVSAGHNMLWRLIPEESGLRGRAFGWTDPKLADVMSQTMLGELDTHFAEVLAAGIPVRYRLNMPDGQFPTEDPEERKYDPAPRVWEKAAGRWSITDRLILLTTRILERVTKVHPNVSVETLGYVNHSSPPARYKPHPHITWTIAPIDFNRHHPMDWPDHVNEYWLRDMVQGWASQNVSLGAYWYGMNLAELSAPCPFIAKWGTDIRILLENNLVAWSPETMNGWDSMLPGYYLSARMTFDAKETPEEILDDLWTRFYGPAAKPMASYWTGDAQVFIRTAIANMDVAAFFTKWMNDLMDAQTDEGAFPNIAPNILLQPAAKRGDAAWGDAGVVCPWTLFQCYEDRALLTKMYPHMKAWVSYLKNTSKSYLRHPDITPSFGDWLSIGSKTPVEIVQTAHFALATDITRKAAEALGKEKDAKNYKTLFSNIQ